MVAAKMKMGFRLAMGQVGWSAPLEQEAIFFRKLAWHMATCAMDIVHTRGLAALSRLMYTQVGSPKCTREDGGAAVCYGTVAFDLWDRMKMHEHQSGKPGGRRRAVFGHPMGVYQVAWREAWDDIVHALPLLDLWPFWRGESKYPKPSVEKMYVEKVRRLSLGRLQYFWPQAAGAAKPFTSDLVAPTSRRNPLLPAGGTGLIGEGSPGSGGSRRSSLLPESSSSTCSPGPQPTVRPKLAPVTVRLTRQ